MARRLRLPSFKIHNDLNSIEKSIGTPLILRNQNRFLLTDVGQNFAEFCRIVVENIGLVQPSSEFPEELTIATTHGIAGEELPEILTEFYKFFPNVRINILTGPEYADFTDPRVDLLMGAHLTNRGDLSQTHLMTDTLQLYAAPSYLEKYGVPKSIYDLRGHRLLSLMGMKLLPRDVFETIDPFLVTNNLASLYKMTLAGQGIAPLPKSRLRSADISNRNLDRVLEGHICAEIKLHFIQKRFSLKKTLTEKLSDIVKQYFKQGASYEEA